MIQLSEIKKTKTIEEYLRHPFWQVGPANTDKANERNAKRIAIEVVRNAKAKTEDEYYKDLTKKIKLPKERFTPGGVNELMRELQTAYQWIVALPEKERYGKLQNQTTKEKILDTQEGLLNLYKKGIVRAIAIPKTEIKQKILTVAMGPFLLQDDRDRSYTAETPMLKVDFYINDATGPRGWTNEAESAAGVMAAERINCHEAQNTWVSESYPHPHISGGRICLGAARPMIARAFATGDFPTAIQVIFNTLSTYNGSSPHKPLLSFVKPEIKKCEVCKKDYDAKMLMFLYDRGPTEQEKFGTHCHNCYVTALSKKGNYIRVPKEEAHQDIQGETLWRIEYPHECLYIDNLGRPHIFAYRKTHSERRGLVTFYDSVTGVNFTSPVAESNLIITAVDEEPITRGFETKAITEKIATWMKSNQGRSFSTYVLDTLRKQVKVGTEGKHWLSPEAEGRLSLLKKIEQDLMNLANEVQNQGKSETERTANEGSESQQEQEARAKDIQLLDALARV